MSIFRIPNILYIHIPKTGGLFYKKLPKKCTISNLLVRGDHLTIEGHSPQHSTYKELYENRKFLDINFDTVEIIASVRNPYTRIISDLFFFKIIDKTNTPEIVERKMIEFLESSNNYDNHKKRQIDYLLYNGKIDPKIKIIKLETLEEDMFKLGYSDFNCHSNSTNNNDNYMKYFTRISIDYINNFYFDDFNYEIL